MVDKKCSYRHTPFTFKVADLLLLGVAFGVAAIEVLIIQIKKLNSSVVLQLDIC